MTTKSILTAIAAVAAMTISASAFAAPASSDTEVSVKVSLAGIDLQSQAGAQVVLNRIHFAARQICGEEPADRLDGQVQYRACMTQVTQGAVARLGNPAVTALNGPVKSVAKVVLTASR